MPAQLQITDIPPVCPICGQFAEVKQTRYGKRASCCDLWSWDGKPLVDAETHHARQEAHAIFDPIWKNGEMTRSQAYSWLKKQLKLDKTPHMAEMDIPTAQLVVRVCEARLTTR